MQSLLISGLLLGLSAGLSPGPMLTLVIFQTLKHGVLEGIKVSLAPLLTDVPIVAVTLLVLTRLSDMKPVLGAISIFGGLYLFYLGYGSITFRGADFEEEDAAPQSLQKGLIVNFLNPNPYLFWTSIGGPLVIKAANESILSAFSFIIPFYVLLVGSKCMIAAISGRTMAFVNSGYYIFIIRFFGLILFGFGLVFLRDGLQYFGIVC